MFVEVRGMAILFLISLTAVLLWIAFGDKRDWAGM